MLLSRTLLQWVSRKAESLNRQSIIHRLFGSIHIGRFHPFDDQVKGLNSRPLGMFVYNQRALFLGVGILFLLLLALLIRIWPADQKMVLTVRVLAGLWLANVVFTLILHRSFKRRLNQWISSPAASEFPPLFDRYFHLDCVSVALLILLGRLFEVNLDAFAFLLFANTLVYSTYIQGGAPDNHRSGIAFVIQLLIAIGFLVTMRPSLDEPRWFYGLLNAAPIVGMSVITLFSVLMVSLLRSVEHGITQRRLELLGRYERVLSEHAAKSNRVADVVEYSEKQFREQATKVLKNLCALEPPFWYHSACLWLAEQHQDRGIVLLPGPRIDFDEAEHFQHGLDCPKHVFESSELLLLHSLKRHEETDHEGFFRFRRDLDIPAAFVQLRRNGHSVGVLAVYGKEGGPPLMREDDAFLRAFGSILSNTMEQWEGRYKTQPQKEMDSLFGCQSLDEVFPEAARILKKYLEAAACMVVFRPDSNGLDMEIVATEGFSKSKLKKHIYKVGEGQTGKCAESGKPLRWDYLPRHMEVFDQGKLKALEKAHGHKIKSWMAIPIGDKQNYGVIKVINSEFRCSWFTDQDQQLGEDLARRLHVMIEKFKHIEQIEEAKDRAQRNAAQAERMQARAEKFAKQRQEDLMIITHQLQGPLSSIIFTVRNMQRKLLHQGIQDERLKYVHALVEDALALSFGTFSTFAREAGKDTFFGATDIDAPAALESLCERLQKTNAKANLRFVYKVEEGFPILRMDTRVFTSVFYSLIHNAMKYADPYSRVILECSFERATGKAALKVKSIGEPITPQEKELIFEKYKRGNIVEQTGRYHSGVGLGLWVARELMTAVGGGLTVELSPDQPELSVFVVHVPMNA
jgi:signal transduction histidine kinase